jgi:hypothetical protein
VYNIIIKLIRAGQTQQSPEKENRKMLYQVKKNDETVALFSSERDAKWFAVDKALRNLRMEYPNYEEENELCFDELPDYEILDEANIEVEETNADKELLLNI